jgi:outer membrane protein
MSTKMKKHALALLPFLVMAVGLTAPGAFAQGTAAAPAETVTLDQLVAAATPSAPGLKLAVITLDSSRAQLIQAQAKGGLSLGGSGDYFHQGNLPGTSSTSSAATSSSARGVNGENIQGGLTLSGPATSLGLTALHSIPLGATGDQVSSASVTGSQTVYDGYPGGRAAAAVQQAVDTYQSAQVTYDAALKSVTYQVKQAYYTVLGDQNTVLVRQAAVAQAQENLSLLQGLLAAQRATPLDVLQVQVTLTQAQLDLRSAQNAAVVDRKKLSLTVGWPIDREYTVADGTLLEMPNIQPADAVSAAYKNRAELRTLELNIAAANVNLGLQKSQGLPVVSVNGSVGIAQDWTANVSSGIYSAGVTIALPPLLDGGLQNAQVQQAALQVSSYKVQQDQQRQSIAIDVQNALFSVRDARDRLDLAGQNVAQAQGEYDLEKAKRAVGLETTLNVLTAFSALTTAHVGLEQARSTYNLAVLNLNNVMGL